VKNILKLWITFRSLLCRVSLEQLRKGLFQSIMGSNPNSGSIQVPFFDGTYEGKRNKLGLRSRVFGNNSSLDASSKYMRLLDCYALCQISGLIHIKSP